MKYLSRATGPRIQSISLLTIKTKALTATGFRLLSALNSVEKMYFQALYLAELPAGLEPPAVLLYAQD